MIAVDSSCVTPTVVCSEGVVEKRAVVSKCFVCMADVEVTVNIALSVVVAVQRLHFQEFVVVMTLSAVFDSVSTLAVVCGNGDAVR